jgi:hypothetical protein
MKALDQLPPDAIVGVERRERILEDHRHCFASKAAKSTRRLSHQLLAIEQDFS